MTLAGQEMPGKREQMAITWQPGDRAVWAEGLAAWQAETGGGSAREYVLWLISAAKRVKGDDELVRRLEAAGVDQIVAAHWQRRKAEDRLLEAIADAVAAARATAEQAVAAELAELREQCATLRTERDELRVARDELVKLRDKLYAEADEVDETLSRCKTECREQAARIVSLQADADKACAEAEAAKAEIVDRDRQINVLTAKVNEAEGKVMRLSVDAGEAEHKAAEAQADAVAAQAELAHLRDRLAQMEQIADGKDKALSTAMIDMAANRATAEAQAATIGELRATIGSLRDALAAIGDRAQTAANNVPSLADLDKVQTLEELDDIVIEYEAKAGKGKRKSVIGLLASLLRGPHKPKAAKAPETDDDLRNIFEIAKAEIERRKAEAAAAAEQPAPWPEDVQVDPVLDNIPEPDPAPAPDPGLSAADLFAADAGGGADDIPEPEFAPAPELPAPDPFGPPPDPFAGEEPQNGPQEPRKGRGRRKG